MDGLAASRAGGKDVPKPRHARIVVVHRAQRRHQVMHGAEWRRRVLGRWCSNHCFVVGEAMVVVIASSNVHPQAKASSFTEKLTKCVKEFRLYPMISEKEANANGTMICQHDQLENEGCRRHKTLGGHCTLGSLLAPCRLLMLIDLSFKRSKRETSGVLITCCE